MGFLRPRRQRRVHGTRTGPPRYEVGPAMQPTKVVSFSDKVEVLEQGRQGTAKAKSSAVTPARGALQSGTASLRGVPEAPAPKTESGNTERN